MKSATLIFPHQLFEDHPAIEKGRSIYLAEDPLFFGNDEHYPVAFHKQNSSSIVPQCRHTRMSCVTAATP